jgi:hypothetical protein
VIQMKKLISILLTLSLIFGLSTHALADETGGELQKVQPLTALPFGSLDAYGRGKLDLALSVIKSSTAYSKIPTTFRGSYVVMVNSAISQQTYVLSYPAIVTVAYFFSSDPTGNPQQIHMIQSTYETNSPTYPTTPLGYSFPAGRVGLDRLGAWGVDMSGTGDGSTNVSGSGRLVIDRSTYDVSKIASKYSNNSGFIYAGQQGNTLPQSPEAPVSGGPTGVTAKWYQRTKYLVIDPGDQDEVKYVTYNPANYPIASELAAMYAAARASSELPSVPAPTKPNYVYAWNNGWFTEIDDINKVNRYTRVEVVEVAPPSFTSSYSNNQITLSRT